MLQHQPIQNDKLESTIHRETEPRELDPVFIPSITADRCNATVTENSAMSEITNSWAFQFAAGVAAGLVAVGFIATVVFALYPA